MSPHLPRRTMLLAGLAVAIARPAFAQATDPSAPIQALNDALLQIMHAGTKTPFGERARLVTPAIEAAFDLPQILKISVGSRWAEIPLPQQLELTEIFRRYTIASYVANFNGFSGEKFDISPQTRAVGDDQVVETRIVPTTGDPTRIDYVMRRYGSAWKAVDVLLDGSISRVAVQRSDFRALVGSGDAGKLIATLRTKTEALEAGRKS